MFYGIATLDMSKTVTQPTIRVLRVRKANSDEHKRLTEFIAEKMKEN